MSATLSSLFRLPSRATVERLGWTIAIALGTATFGWLVFGLVIGFGHSAKILATVLAVATVLVGIFGASALLLLGIIWGLEKMLGFIARVFSAPEPEEAAAPTVPVAVESVSVPVAAAPAPAQYVATPARQSMGSVMSETGRELAADATVPILGAAFAAGAMFMGLHFVATMPVPQFTSTQQRGFEYLGSRPLGGFSPLTPAFSWLGRHPEVGETFLVLLAVATLAGLLYAGYRVAMALYRVVLATAHRLGRVYATMTPVVRRAYRTTASIIIEVYRTSSDIGVLASLIAGLCRRELVKVYLPRAKSAWLSAWFVALGGFLEHTNGQRHPRVAAVLATCYRATRRASDTLAIEPRSARHRRDTRQVLVPEPRPVREDRVLVGAIAD